ncbi:hypothetical protein Hoch_2923 [Haliangium ochraceum DSM 14365]|uniref:Uncharacterized protein n=1 Tax=Haliangium ochraceum (strain DSM 14365 / JCM 11303 / SMP-2) TaxID=502025 RepID=D0LPS7_HALO1|nr:hypothetical protein Hoch_2923 [Haliangium ochraceum DSM 14365]
MGGASRGRLGERVAVWHLGPAGSSPKLPEATPRSLPEAGGTSMGRWAPRSDGHLAPGSPKRVAPRWGGTSIPRSRSSPKRVAPRRSTSMGGHLNPPLPKLPEEGGTSPEHRSPRAPPKRVAPRSGHLHLWPGHLDPPRSPKRVAPRSQAPRSQHLDRTSICESGSPPGPALWARGARSAPEAGGTSGRRTSIGRHLAPGSPKRVAPRWGGQHLGLGAPEAGGTSGAPRQARAFPEAPRSGWHLDRQHLDGEHLDPPQIHLEPLEPAGRGSEAVPEAGGTSIAGTSIGALPEAGGTSIPGTSIPHLDLGHIDRRSEAVPEAPRSGWHLDLGIGAPRAPRSGWHLDLGTSI